MIEIDHPNARFFDAFVEGFETSAGMIPPESRALYLEQALAACLAVTRRQFPDETPAICRRTFLDVMIATPAPPPRWRRLLAGSAGFDAGTAWAVASYALLIAFCAASAAAGLFR